MLSWSKEQQSSHPPALPQRPGTRRVAVLLPARSPDSADGRLPGRRREEAPALGWELLSTVPLIPLPSPSLGVGTWGRGAAGARFLGMEEVAGSIPAGSTIGCATRTAAVGAHPEIRVADLPAVYGVSVN